MQLRSHTHTANAWSCLHILRYNFIISLHLIIFPAEVDLGIKEEGLTPLDENLRYREVSLNSSVQLLSLSIVVSVEQVRVSKRQTSSQLQTNQCLLVLYGDDAETVLVSNVVR